MARAAWSGGSSNGRLAAWPAERFTPRVMDGHGARPTGSGSFDAAISIFGVVLFPDAGRRPCGKSPACYGPGGQVAVVTWTQPQRYELAARLIGRRSLAVQGVEEPHRPGSRHSSVLLIPPRSAHSLTDAGLAVDRIVTVMERSMDRPGARAGSAERIALPGAWNGMMQALGKPEGRAVVRQVRQHPGTTRKASGPISLSAVAHVAFGRRP